jgi:hypothetical protein
MNTRPGWYNLTRKTYHHRVCYDESGGGFDESGDESDGIGLVGWTLNDPLGYSISTSRATSTMNSRLEMSTTNDPLGYSISMSLETLTMSARRGCYNSTRKTRKTYRHRGYRKTGKIDRRRGYRAGFDGIAHNGGQRQHDASVN